MAGIGFELKKLFRKSGLFSFVRAHLYSIFVTVGPIVISVLAITFLQFLLKYIGTPTSQRELLQATIMYSFVFSVILTSGYCMMLSRYLSDRLYLGKNEDILPALYGSATVLLIVAGIIGLVFYLKSPLYFAYKFFAYLLFIQLVFEILLSIYVSAVKNFKRVAFSFFYGTIVGYIAAWMLIKFALMDHILAVLIGFDLCIFVVNVLLALEIQQYFRDKSSLYFNFLKSSTHYYLVFLTNFFFNLGLYIHSMVFWANPEVQQVLGNTYVFAPTYDVPASFAFLSSIPTLVMFVVKVETALFEKFRNYFYLINNGACYEDIEVAKTALRKTVFRELLYAMEIQLFFTISCIILGMKFLPLTGFTASMVFMYSILALGYFCVIIMFVIITLLLYFDNQKGACLIALHFAVTSFLFSLCTVYLGESYYGFGFFMAGLMSLLLSILVLVKYFKNIDYYVFCIHVSWKEKEGGLLDNFIDKLNQIGG